MADSIALYQQIRTGTGSDRAMLLVHCLIELLIHCVVKKLNEPRLKCQ